MKKTFIISALLSLFLLGCYQEEGQRCEIDDDCATDLKCCKPFNSDEGTCRTEANCDTGKKK